MMLNGEMSMVYQNFTLPLAERVAVCACLVCVFVFVWETGDLKSRIYTTSSCIVRTA